MERFTVIMGHLVGATWETLVCLQVLDSFICVLVIIVTVALSAALSAADKPAMPVPMIR